MGGTNRYPKNTKTKETNEIKIKFKTQYTNAWLSYLNTIQNYLKTFDSVEYANAYKSPTNPEWVYLHIKSNENITYHISSTDLGGPIKEPTVTTLENGTTWSNAAILNMSYNFKDYSEGEVRFQFKEAVNGTWSSTGWETQYGENNNHTRLIKT